MMAQRPALAAALAALSGTSKVGLLRSYIDGLQAAVPTFRGLLLRYGSYDVMLAPMRYTDPAESAEILAGEGLWPWPVDGAEAARWWCLKCQGGTRQVDEALCDWCKAGAHVGVPSLPALLSVAALGGVELLRATAFADVLAPAAPVVWRPVPPDDLLSYHLRSSNRPYSRQPPAPTLVEAFSYESCVGKWANRSVWFRDTSAAAHAAWPAMRDLAATGAHLLECSRSRVVLGVESL